MRRSGRSTAHPPLPICSGFDVEEEISILSSQNTDEDNGEAFLQDPLDPGQVKGLTMRMHTLLTCSIISGSTWRVPCMWMMQAVIRKLMLFSFVGWWLRLGTHRNTRLYDNLAASHISTEEAGVAFLRRYG